MIFNLRSILASLATKRPVFHSEADFQFALAWEIQSQFPEAKIRLEIPMPTEQKEYLDILVKIGNRPILIELKCKTKGLTMGYGDEDFKLQNHAAQPCNRYDFLKDISRVERFMMEYPDAYGYCVMLSNETQYWKRGGGDTCDKDFSLQEGRVAQGLLSWQPSTSAGTMKNRERPLFLHHSYSLHWDTYSDTSSFRMLVVDVKRPAVPLVNQQTVCS